MGEAAGGEAETLTRAPCEGGRLAARRTLLAAVLILVCAGPRIPPAAEVSNTARGPLFPILQDSRWGFIDASGREMPARITGAVGADEMLKWMRAVNQACVTPLVACATRW